MNVNHPEDTDEKTKFQRKTQEELRRMLSDLQHDVTQNGATEPPFRNEYYNSTDKGIYVDVTTGEPLFMSTDKFDSGCGWPSFAKPISNERIDERTDRSSGMIRTEVKSKRSGSHLGHVFTDGPDELGGLRYCINSASLRFVPKDRMEQEGYGHLQDLVK